jgi:hypothetical protein
MTLAMHVFLTWGGSHWTPAGRQETHQAAVFAGVFTGD